LVGIYEVLSDAQKRQRYHEVLEFGLPDWRSAVYYYRHVRKMGLLEMTVILFVILTVGQYIVLWAAYAENKYTIVSKRCYYQNLQNKLNTLLVNRSKI
jgi:DnaJ homolog subfamily C member 1